MKRQHLKILNRYHKNYGLAEGAVTYNQVMSHWDLEKKLTQKLLKSSKKQRVQIFQESYTHLYEKLAWLNSAHAVDKKNLASWRRLIGNTPQKIYEIGSGTGALVNYLADFGHACVATEITPLRKGTKKGGVTWRISDGVNLETFEKPNHFDVVISDQVIEHLHPLDLEEHFRGAYAILKTGGRYIFKTPHRYTGPHDVSKVFNKKIAEGMHLKEYTYFELSKVAKRAGFSTVVYPLTKIFFINLMALYWMFFMEKALKVVPFQRWRRFLGKALRKCRKFNDNIILECLKKVVVNRG
jgi:SAM-dependent methyltransferase